MKEDLRAGAVFSLEASFSPCIDGLLSDVLSEDQYLLYP